MILYKPSNLWLDIQIILLCTKKRLTSGFSCKLDQNACLGTPSLFGIYPPRGWRVGHGFPFLDLYLHPLTQQVTPTCVEHYGAEGEELTHYIAGTSPRPAAKFTENQAI